MVRCCIAIISYTSVYIVCVWFCLVNLWLTFLRVIKPCMYNRHGAGTHFPTLQPYHSQTFLPRHAQKYCSDSHTGAATRHNLSVCLAAQLLAVTGVVARALFWPHCWSLIQIFISDGRPHPNVLSIWGAIWEFVQISLSGRDHGLFALSHPCRSVWYHMCWNQSGAENLRQRQTVRYRDVRREEW